MKDTIFVSIASDHAFECDTNIIGRAGEGGMARLAITFAFDVSDCTAYLKFEKPNEEKHKTDPLTVDNGVAIYDVEKHLLTDSGELKTQLILKNGSGGKWKTAVKRFTILESIEAGSSSAENYVESIEKWSPETRAYNVGDMVIYNGNFYICVTPMDVGEYMSIPSSSDKWEAYSGIYKGEWNIETTYKAGNVVSHNGSVYMCIKTHIGSEPLMLGSNMYWECINAYTYVEDFNTYPTYKAGTIVKYNGSVYLCTQETNILYYPDKYPDYWEKLND